MFRIQIRLYPFHFGQPDPIYKTDPDTDPDSKKSAKIKENLHITLPKLGEYNIFTLDIKLMFIGQKYLPQKKQNK